ncbi:hypothetical protein R3P38DRAFT_2517124, partial [Favolaschia claudopus]
QKGDVGHVKRAPNSFILFRAATSTVARSTIGRCIRHADLSKIIAQEWKCLPNVERAKWEALALQRKHEHKMLHPGYVYRPRRTERRKYRTPTTTPTADKYQSESVTFSNSTLGMPNLPQISVLGYPSNANLECDWVFDQFLLGTDSRCAKVPNIL